MNLNGAHVVITGASQGIGRELALAFAAEGAKVLGVARSADKLEGLAREIDGEFVVADLTSQTEVDGLVDACVSTLGHVDVWVNNAGVETADPLTALPRDDIRTLARLNVEAPFMLTRDVLVHMLERGSGHIVQMSSLAGAVALPGMAAYAGSKAGLTNFTESVRMEMKMAGEDIGLTVVSPGPVDTEMWDRIDSEQAPYMEAGLKRFRRIGFLPKLSPESVARKTVSAVKRGKRVARMPAHFNLHHMLNNAPRRIIGLVLAGVRAPLGRAG